MSPSDVSERRRYYRIQDQIGLEYRVITADTAPPLAAACFDGSATAGLQQELRRADLEIRTRLNVLTESDRNLAHLLKLMNQKLDTAARIMTFQQKPLQDDQWLQVTLSEGGMAFHCPDVSWQPGELLALRMTLAPELNQVAVFAEVVEIETGSKAQKPFMHLEFRHLEDDCRQQIARHVLQLQARMRQQQQDNNENGTG
ncbi:MAG: PilZ domain-containing protein [Halomonadaceae bacterium]|nr:MAG: PilZ domain-containing protein [Halomonadaceae bacterium]